MTRINFEKVALNATKAGKCRCGKRRTRSKTFEQTINPWNVIKDGPRRGLPKTEREIRLELSEAARAWRHEAITCANCEEEA